MDEKKIARINELYHKSKAEGLNEQELAEQKQLRQEYIQAIRGNIRSQLDQIKVVNEEGIVVDLKNQH